MANVHGPQERRVDCDGPLIAARQTKSLSPRPIASSDIKYPEPFDELEILGRGEFQARSAELGERLHLDSGTLTPLLKRLAVMGYVTRSRDAEDERRVLVTVTADGLALRDRLAAVPESFLACLGMDVADASALRDQLTALTAFLEAGAR